MTNKNKINFGAFKYNFKAFFSRSLFFLLFTALLLNAGGALSLENLENKNESGKSSSSLEQAEELIRQKREEIKQIQEKIENYQSEVKVQQQKARTLEREMAIYQNRISKNELEIDKTKLYLEEAELEIKRLEEKIKENEDRIIKDKEMLKSLVKLLYAYDQDSMLEILISHDNLSDFLLEVDAVESLKNEILKAIMDLKKEKGELNAKTEELERQNEEHQQLIQVKFQQNESLNELKNQKEEILEITKGEEKKFQQILEENKNILPTLKAQLHELQSLGKKIQFDDAISAAKHIGAVTSVRPEFILGILKVESDLGTNVGGGNYKTDMNPRQRPVFEAIVSELGYNPNEMPVSKKPRSYSGWGGAMGPAQMIPTTWRIYQNEIAEITGHNPPDPWNLDDAVAALAVKVSKVDGVTNGKYEAEYEAAGLYFAGKNWRKFLFYPDRVMLYADLYSKELN